MGWVEVLLMLEVRL